MSTASLLHKQQKQTSFLINLYSQLVTLIHVTSVVILRKTSLHNTNRNYFTIN